MEYAKIVEKMQDGTREHTVLSHLLKYGEITSLEAFAEYNITRLSASIYILRHTFNIPIEVTNLVSTTIRDGRKICKRYAKYYISEEKDV